MSPPSTGGTRALTAHPPELVGTPPGLIIPLCSRYKETYGGKPQAGFCEGETRNRAWSNTVTLPPPEGGSNGEHKADLNTEGVLSTRPGTQMTIVRRIRAGLPLGSGRHEWQAHQESGVR